MNKRERFFNTLDHKPVDQALCGFWRHFLPYELGDDDGVTAHAHYYRATNLDFVKMMSDGYFEYPFSAKIETASDWRRIRPLGKDHHHIRGQVERAKGVNALFQAERACLFTIFVPFSVIRHTLGEDLVMTHLKEDREAVMQGMQVVLEDQLTLIRCIMEEAGCDALYLPLQGGEEDRFTEDEYRTIVKPFDDPIYELANTYSDYNIGHLCAWDGKKNHLDLWKDLPVKALNWAVHIEDLTMPDGMKFFAPQVPFGGFDNRKGSLICSGSKEEVQEYAKQIIRSCGGKNIILGADCSLPSDIAPERIRWIVDAAREEGGLEG